MVICDKSRTLFALIRKAHAQKAEKSCSGRMPRTLTMTCSIFFMAIWSAFLGLGVGSSPALALPQYVQHGYFGCQSCHASPTGGGVLTPYGRSVASEKISTWAYKNEEQPLHGLVGEIPEWLLLGGNFRQMQTAIENDQIKEGRYFTMQRDFELGLHVGKWWAVGSAGKETSAYPDPNGSYPTISRHHFLRYDFSDEWMVRAGKFYPRFGLMIPAHTSGVRRGMGFDQGQETNNLELTYGGEQWEFSLTGVVAPWTKGQIKEENREHRGFYGSVAYFFLERNRASLSLSRVQEGLFLRLKESLAATLSAKQWNLMAEVARSRIVKNKIEGANQPGTAMFSYLRLGHDLARGVTPYFLHETRMPDAKQITSKTQLVGGGLQLNPRPHLEIDASTGVVLKPATFDYSRFGLLMFHYYL